MNRNATEYCQNMCKLIKDFSLPLEKYFGIKEFHYCKAFKTGKYILISTNNQLNQSFFNKISYSNIFFQDYLNYDSLYDMILWPNHPSNDAMQIYLDYGYWHGISLVIESNEESVEMVAFLGDSNNPDIIYFYCRYFQILEKFIKQFKKIFSKEFDFNSDDKRLAFLTKGIDINIPDKKLIQDKKIINEFYKSIGIESESYSDIELLEKLTTREKECLKLLTKGFSIKYIAKQLEISVKTAETHIYNIKKKLAYNNRDNIIKNFKDCF